MSANYPTAYGEPLAGAPIDIKRILLRPLIISRFISMLLSIIVFSLILSGGWEKDRCILNSLRSNCNFVTFIGVTSLLIALTFVVCDCILSQINSLQSRKLITLIDLIIACVYTFLWLVITCVLIAEWWKTPDATLVRVPVWQFRNIHAAVAFSIFCIAIWALTSYFATYRYYIGTQEQQAMTDNINRSVAVNNRSSVNNTRNDNENRGPPRSTPIGSEYPQRNGEFDDIYDASSVPSNQTQPVY